MAGPNTFTDKIISPDIVRDLREKLGMIHAELTGEAKISEDEVKAYEAGAVYYGKRFGVFDKSEIVSTSVSLYRSRGMKIGLPEIAENDRRCPGLRRIEARFPELVDDPQRVEWGRCRLWPRAAQTQLAKAAMPVWARPRISAWMSCVPS
jgi:hypothetical protein